MYFFRLLTYVVLRSFGSLILQALGCVAIYCLFTHQDINAVMAVPVDAFLDFVDDAKDIIANRVNNLDVAEMSNKI